MKRAARMSVATGWAVFALVIATSLAATIAAAQPLSADPADIGEVLRAMKAPNATESPLLFHSEEGFLRFLGAPPGGGFEARASALKADDPAERAKNFVDDHAGAFGVANGQVAFTTHSVRQHAGLSFVRLDQAYAGIPVFGAQAVLSIQADGRVAQVLSDVLRDTRSLDTGAVSLTPAIDAATAAIKAKTGLADLLDGVSSSALTAEDAPALHIFSPSVLGIEGTTKLAWRQILAGTGPKGPLRHETFVDAQSGALILHYSLIHNALNRMILDENFNVLRTEGGAPTGIGDADRAYDFLGDSYDYFLNQHGRDGIDGLGGQIVAQVGIPNFFNAAWNGFWMLFGPGWVTDDVTAHELTHGVTDDIVNFVYFGWSGALSESMSDIWGEIIDFTNNRGDDTPQNRWLIGEEVIWQQGPFTFSGPFRNMKNPPQFGDPDALDSPLVWNVNSFFDNGGVHHNSGIGNKLCYLLTDGDTFNGFNIFGMGHETVTDLFYASLFLLTPTADYHDLYYALEASALNMDLDEAERCNIFAACRAVRIVPPEVFRPISEFKATSARTNAGNPAVVLTWSDPVRMCTNPVSIIREEIGTGKALGDIVTIATDTTKPVLDTNVREGIEYLYTLTALHPLTMEPVTLMTTIIGGEDPPRPMAEVFDNDPATGDALPLDLSFSQLLFAPTGPPGAGPGAIEDYEITVKRNVNSLPVHRSDANGSGYIIPLSYQGGVLVPIGSSTLWWIPGFGSALERNFENFSFPFFGQRYSGFYVSANGYISFRPIEPFVELNQATTKAHFAIPRISFLFGDLAPDTSGQVWVRDMPDRAVITFEDIPEEVYGLYPQSNTVQVELFHSGQIRITYLSVAMRNVIVGLSDGTGSPVDPAALFPAANLRQLPTRIDFTAQPTLPGRMSLAPVPVQGFGAGERAQFTISATLPAGLANADPQFYLLEGPGVIIDQGASARYVWDPAQFGLHNIRVAAVLGEHSAFQDVRLTVGLTLDRPAATNLTLTSDIPIANGLLAPGHPLTASYAYFHPLAQQDPQNYGEGATILHWYRNGQQVGSLTNRPTIASTQITPGDRWQFRVTPATLNGIVGPEAVSEQVQILGGPDIVSVTPAFGLITGGATVSIKGSGLNGPISVKFGGVNAASFRVISDNEIVAVTPVRSAGEVDVEVTTGHGTGRLVRGFRYLEDVGDIIIGDVNGDGRVDALDVQIVVGVVLKLSTMKADINADVNGDGVVNAADVQFVVNRALYR